MSSSTWRRSASEQPQERLVEAAPAFGVEPHQPAAHRHLPPSWMCDEVVDELGHARLGRAARPLVLRDDQVGEGDDRGEFGAVKNFGL